MRNWKRISELASDKSKGAFFLKADQILSFHNHYNEAPLVRVIHSFKAWESPDSFHPLANRKYSTCNAGSLGFIDFGTSVICFPHDPNYEYLLQKQSVTPRLVLSFPGKFNSFAILNSNWNAFKESCEIDTNLFEGTPI